MMVLLVFRLYVCLCCLDLSRWESLHANSASLRGNIVPLVFPCGTATAASLCLCLGHVVCAGPGGLLCIASTTNPLPPPFPCHSLTTAITIPSTTIPLPQPFPPPSTPCHNHFLPCSSAPSLPNPARLMRTLWLLRLFLFETTCYLGLMQRLYISRTSLLKLFFDLESIYIKYIVKIHRIVFIFLFSFLPHPFRLLFFCWWII